MSRIGRGIEGFGVAAVLCIGLSSSLAAQTRAPAPMVTIETIDVTVYRTKAAAAVPKAKSETRSRAPSAHAIWIPGFWNLQGDRQTATRAGWVWVPGRWLTPPVRNARWDPAHWGWSDEWWTWIPAHWVQRGPHGYPPSLQQDEASAADNAAI
jgi:hypothetical protein